MTAPAAAEPVEITYAPRGAARAIFADHAPELVTTGPAGTGKTLAWCQKAHLIAATRRQVRILFCRKTRQSLKESVIPTYENKVNPFADGVVWRAAKGRYEYPNGSVIALGGLDKPSRIMSTEWDLIIVFECTECSVGEWEALSTRLRNNRMPYQQLGGDANPDAATHWLRQRIDAGKTREYVSYHEDNPTLFDPVTGEQTAIGTSYLAKLDNLTGVRYLRLRKGKWAAAEGIVYEEWDRAIHLVDRFTPPMDWPRYWVIDFGFTHPFVWQLWVRDNDGRLYLWREIYRTRRLVEEHARAIFDCVSRAQDGGKPDRAPSLIICDPEDAEGRATLSRTWLQLGAAVTSTVAAHKSVTRGIQEVQGRFKPAGDNRPRLFLMRDARIHDPDQELVDARLPTCTADEVESYVWQPNAQGKREQPVKLNDHGMDAMRYVVAEIDLVGEPDYAPSIYG
jgi:hypothetical protein